MFKHLEIDLSDEGPSLESLRPCIPHIGITPESFYTIEAPVSDQIWLPALKWLKLVAYEKTTIF